MEKCDTDIEIYNKAVKVFGEEYQINQTIQELVELIKELTKIKQNNSFKNYEKIVEEMVDANIMFMQLEVILRNIDQNYENLYKAFFDKKLLNLQLFLDKNV